MSQTTITVGYDLEPIETFEIENGAPIPRSNEFVVVDGTEYIVTNVKHGYHGSELDDDVVTSPEVILYVHKTDDDP